MPADVHGVFHADWFYEENDGAADDSQHFNRDGNDWRIAINSRYGLNSGNPASAYASHGVTHDVPDVDHGLRVEATILFDDAQRYGGVYFLHDGGANPPDSTGNGYGVVQEDNNLRIFEVAAGVQTQQRTVVYVVGQGETVYYYITADVDSGGALMINVRVSKVNMNTAKAAAVKAEWIDVVAPFTTGSTLYLFLDGNTGWFENIQLYWEAESPCYECFVKHTLTKGANTFEAIVGRNPDTGTVPFYLGMGIRIFAQDTNDAVVQQFEGQLEEIVKTERFGSGMACILRGRDFRGELMDRLVNAGYDDTYHNILDAIVENYSEHLTWEGSIIAAGGAISRDFRERNAYEAIRDLAEENGFYVYQDMERRLIVNDTFNDATAAIKLTTDNAVAGNNKVMENSVPVSLHQLINRVKVYGDETLGPQPFADQSDGASISAFGTREFLWVDKRIETNAQCQARANYIKDRYKDSVEHMSIDVFGHETVFPGDIVEVTIGHQALSGQAFLVLDADYDLMSEQHHFELVKGTAGAPATANEVHRRDFEKVQRDLSERVSRLETHRVV